MCKNINREENKFSLRKYSISEKHSQPLVGFLDVKVIYHMAPRCKGGKTEMGLEPYDNEHNIEFLYCGSHS